MGSHNPQRGDQEIFAYLIVSLLKCDGEGRESVLRCEALVGTRGQEETDHRVVVLLRRHVQRGEPMLALNVHSTALLHQNLHNLILKIPKERRGGQLKAHIPATSWSQMRLAVRDIILKIHYETK